MLFFSLLIMTCAYGASSNELQRVFNHRLAVMPDLTTLDLGKVVLYFSQEPIVKKGDAVSSVQKNGYQEIVFTIPQVTSITSEAKQAIAALNMGKNPAYSVSIERTQKPVEGIEIKIIYDPKKVHIDYDLFDVIANKAKGLEFRFSNKSLLDILKHKGQTILRTAHAGKPVIIVDCGHGGYDRGTKGFFDTVEKDLTLCVGLTLAQQLQTQGMPVILTRSDDRFVPLDERTFIANKYPHALFISLHVNNAPREQVHGLETFCLASNLFKKDTQQLETAIDVIIQNTDYARYQESKNLAHSVHAAVLKAAHASGYDQPDRGIRYGVATVLHGSFRCPGIVLELDYASNQKGARFLKNPANQTVIAQGICNGIQDWLKLYTATHNSRR